VSLATTCRFSSNSSTDQQHTAHVLEALYGRPSRAHFQTSSLFEVNCSSADVRSLTINWLEIRAHTRIVTNSAVRACFCGKMQRTDRTGCSVAREQYTGGLLVTSELKTQVRPTRRPASHVTRRPECRSNKLSAKAVAAIDIHVHTKS